MDFEKKKKKKKGRSQFVVRGGKKEAVLLMARGVAMLHSSGKKKYYPYSQTQKTPVEVEPGCLTAEQVPGSSFLPEFYITFALM